MRTRSRKATRRSSRRRRRSPLSSAGSEASSASSRASAASVPSKRRAGSGGRISAPQRTMAPASCASIGRVGAGDHRGAEGRAHVEQDAGRLVAHALIAARQPHRLAIGLERGGRVAGALVGVSLGHQALDRRGARRSRRAQQLQRLGGAPGVAQHQRQQQRPYALAGEATRALARQPRRLVVAPEIAVGARDRQKGIVGWIGFGGFLENGGGFSGLAVLLQERGEIHRHQPVVGAGGQHGAQRRLGLGHVAAAGLQHRRFSLLGSRLGACVCRNSSKRQHCQEQPPAPPQRAYHR